MRLDAVALPARETHVTRLKPEGRNPFAEPLSATPLPTELLSIETINLSEVAFPLTQSNDIPVVPVPPLCVCKTGAYPSVGRLKTMNTVLSALCKNLKVAVLLGIVKESSTPSSRSTSLPPCTADFRSGLLPLVACVACLLLPLLSCHLATAPSAATSEPPLVAS
jgi:hypothetical protein